MDETLDPQVAALRRLCERVGGHDALAREIEVNGQSIYQIVSGRRLPSGNPKGVGPALRAKLTQRYPDWLELGKPIQAIYDTSEPIDGVVYIPESEIKLSGGPGQVAYTDTPGSIPIPYMADWLAKAGIPHGKGRRFKIKGESMEETLFDGDTVLVNTAETDVVDGKVYAFTWDGEFRVKRLFKRISGGLVIHSDNPRFLPRSEEFTAEEVDEHMHIIGRVKDKSGSGGL